MKTYNLTKAYNFFCISLGVIFLGACSSVPLKKIDDVKPQKIEFSIIPGSYNVEHFKTYSRVKVYDLAKEPKVSEPPSEDTIEKATFKLNRKALDVDEKNRVQFQHWVTQVKGKVDLASMGFPPPGKILMSVVAPDASIVAVKDVPIKTIFYMPRIPLPSKKVSSGDVWDFEQEWRSLKTGWPFSLHLKMKLENWYRCGGLECAHITYKGYVKAPKESPVSQGILKSQVEGEFIYAPIGHQFLWTSSKSSEVFTNAEKKVEVSSCVTSLQIQPNKENKAFFSKYKNQCLDE